MALLLNYAQDRARDEGVPIDIDALWLMPKLQKGVCEATGLKLDMRNAETPHRSNPFAPSLHRKNKKLGYVKTNTQLVCFAVNVSFRDWGDDVMMKIARALIRKHITR